MVGKSTAEVEVDFEVLSWSTKTGNCLDWNDLLVDSYPGLWGVGNLECSVLCCYLVCLKGDMLDTFYSMRQSISCFHIVPTYVRCAVVKFLMVAEGPFGPLHHTFGDYTRGYEVLTMCASTQEKVVDGSYRSRMLSVEVPECVTWLV
jgi:hypothetical protein